jgi:hypothetical protein
MKRDQMKMKWTQWHWNHSSTAMCQMPDREIDRESYQLVAIRVAASGNDAAKESCSESSHFALGLWPPLDKNATQYFCPLPLEI